MYDEPARPSPTPAPIAPPARAMPPPMKAPAVVMSVPDTAAICVSPWLGAGPPTLVLVLRSGPSGRERGLLLALGAGPVVCVVDLLVGLGLVRGLVPTLALVVRLVVVVVLATGHAEVEDGQQREDERLDRADEHVEQLPDDVEEASEYAADRDAADLPGDQRADESEHDGAGEDVAEEPQRQGDRLDELLEDVERRQPGIGLDEVLEVAPEPLLPHAVGPDAEDHKQRHRVGEVRVRGGRRQQVQLVVRLTGNQLEPVGGEDEEEQRHGVRDDRGVDPAQVALDLARDGADHRLPHDLELRGDVVLGVLGQLVAGPEPQRHDDRPRDHGRPDRVQVERPAAQVAFGVLADLDGGLWADVADHCDFSSLSNGMVVITSAISRKIASPNSTPRPDGQKATAITTATTLSSVSRTSVLRTIWLRDRSSPDEITRL